MHTFRKGGTYLYSTGAARRKVRGVPCCFGRLKTEPRRESGRTRAICCRATLNYSTASLWNHHSSSLANGVDRLRTTLQPALDGKLTRSLDEEHSESASYPKHVVSSSKVNLRLYDHLQYFDGSSVSTQATLGANDLNPCGFGWS